MARLIECGYAAAPISDRASAFGFVRWKKLAEKNGLRPIFGVELAVTKSLQEKRPIVDHWTFFARDDLESLHQLIELASSSIQFRYEPLLTYDQANEAMGLLKVVGHRSDLSLVERGKDTFVGLGPASARGYIAEALERGFKLMAVSDNRFPAPADAPLYDVICGDSGQTYPQHILSPEEWAAAVEGKAPPKEVARASRNALQALSSPRWASLRPATILRPQRPATLLSMCEAGAAKLGCDLSDPIYRERLDRELALIASKNFEDYFYIITDIVQWARQRMIVGPARGSSCGSLVCYLLEITTIDPIPFGLIFERFIDVNRDDLPDIDIDFSDQKRSLVFDYVAQKYGRDRVARLGTVAMYQPRSAISEAGAALSVPKWKCEAMLDGLIERSSGDSRALLKLADTLDNTPAGQALVLAHPEIRIAEKMEGHPRHSSSHAAGIVITEEPIRKFVAIDARSGATHCDKKDAEDLGLLKIDALGLTQLSVFEDALALAGLPMDFLETVSMNDQATFKVLNDHHFCGVFQFNGLAVQNTSAQITIGDLNDIVAITALSRPGPLASGGTNTWIKIRAKKQVPDYGHPMFEPYLRETLGVITYQEQVMVICREIGKLSWSDVNALRRAMSKSLGVEFFDQYGGPFKENAIAAGVSPEIAQRMWDNLCSYGSMGFNKAHAVAYGIVSYWCAYLKAHYSLEFAAATLTHESDPAKQIQLLREMDAEGISYVPADIELSTDKWSVSRDRKRLVGPVQNVRGIGPKLTQQIMLCREKGIPLPARAGKLLTEPKTPIDSLWPVRDAFERLLPDPQEKNIFSAPLPINDLQVNGHQYETMVFAVIANIKPRNENEEINIARRGGKVIVGEPIITLYMRIVDDTGGALAKVSRFDYERIGRAIVERGGAGKALYALKGTVPRDFRMLNVKQARFIGMIDDETAEVIEGSGNVRLEQGDE